MSAEVIKAISLWQPWASLWLSPNKLHETRGWETSYRGRLLVHAAKHFEKDVDLELDDILCKQFGLDWQRTLPAGAIIGVVDLTGCHKTEKVYCRTAFSSPLNGREQSDITCGDFASGRFAWRRGTYWVFREPVPFKGHQRIFNVPRAVVSDALANAREVCVG